MNAAQKTQVKAKLMQHWTGRNPRKIRFDSQGFVTVTVDEVNRVGKLSEARKSAFAVNVLEML